MVSGVQTWCLVYRHGVWCTDMVSGAVWKSRCLSKHSVAMAVDFDTTRVSLIRFLHPTAQELCQSLGMCPKHTVPVYGCRLRRKNVYY